MFMLTMLAKHPARAWGSSPRALLHHLERVRLFGQVRQRSRDLDCTLDRRRGLLGGPPCEPSHCPCVELSRALARDQRQEPGGGRQIDGLSLLYAQSSASLTA
jgi:hypothetical protein